MGRAEATKLEVQEIKRTAAQQAKEKANAEMWSVDIVVFMLGVLAIILILRFQGLRAEIAVPIAIFGLGMGWIVGWRQGRRLYKIYYDEELARYGVELKEPEEETVEEMVKKALVMKWKRERPDYDNDV